MKKLFFVAIMCLLVGLGQAQEYRVVYNNYPGHLVFEPDKKIITNLIVEGVMNAVDFRIIRDSMPALEYLDLRDVGIEFYYGTEGTYISLKDDSIPPRYYWQGEIPTQAFYNKTNLVSLVLPTVNYEMSIGSRAFYGFSSIQPINFPKNLNRVSGGLINCYASFTVDPENMTFSAVDGVLYNKTQTQLVQVSASRTGEFRVPSTVTTINGASFNGCNSLSIVNIPSSVTTIITPTFYNCSAAINVDANNTAYSSIDGVLFDKQQTSILHAPYSLSGNYNIPSTVTTIGYAVFYNCSELTSISIPENIKSIVSNVFNGCRKLNLIRLLASTPIEIYNELLKDIDIENCILQVPGGTIAAYKSATGWKNFKNIVEPVATNAASDITFNSATLNGVVSYIGAEPVTSYGFCWNTTGAPTVADNKVDKGATNVVSAFSNTMTDLTEGTKYYVRAYVTDKFGTIYGNQVSFTTQSIPGDAGSIVGATNVCQGQDSVIYTVPLIKNASAYSWTLPAGVTGTSITNTITVKFTKDAVSGNISVKGHNEWFDGQASVLAVTVNALPVNAGAISGDGAVCTGDNAFQYTVAPIDNASSYTWTLPTGATGTSTTNTIAVKFTKDAVSGSISVKGHNDCGDGQVATLPVTVNQSPVFTVSDKTVFCAESFTLASSSDFVGSENLKFKWTPSTGLNNDTIANPTASVTNNITYTVAVTTPNGCTTTGEVNVKIKPMEQPRIGIVGVNSSNKNIVVWNKPTTSGIDAYSIYRETTVSDVYEKVGSVPYSDLSVFTDNSSNPTVKSNKYKLSIVDKSGLETQLSDPHKTMHLTINKGQNNTWNLIWEPYTGFNVLTYNIYRGSSATSLNFIDATSGSSTQFNDVNAPSGDVYYQLEVISPALVYPSQLKSASQKITDAENSVAVSYNSSRSNVASNISSAINDPNAESENIHVYPNPAKDQFRIDCANGSTFEIRNLMGQLIYTGNLNISNVVRTSDFKSGIYLIQLNTGKSNEFKKVIIE